MGSHTTEGSPSIPPNDKSLEKAQSLISPMHVPSAKER